MLQWVMDKFMEIEVARKTGRPQDFKHEHPWTAQPWNSKALLCCRHFPFNGFLYKTDNKLSAWVFRWLADWALLYECRFNKTSKGDSVWRSMMDLRLFSGTKLRTRLDTIVDDEEYYKQQGILNVNDEAIMFDVIIDELSKVHPLYARIRLWNPSSMHF